ncbi:MAG: hypothetical protein KY391_03510 [Actinobacteria bacterium]|nr:hypothetical protein [Actinomycetota bacterium]
MPGEDTLSQSGTLAELQRALNRVQGVERVRVVGDDSPTEIHVIAAGRKPSRQFVRDIESLAAAEFGIQIDHRIVSIVQVETPPTGQAGRPSIERVGVGRRNNSEWVEVTLLWPDGERTSGTGAAGTSREARARGAAAAVLECLDAKLSEKRSTLEIDNVSLHSVSSSTEWVLVHTTFYEEGASTPLLGSARVVDDVATAAALALLNAVNRKLLRA